MPARFSHLANDLPQCSENGGDQLSLRAQEAEVEAGRTRADTRNHEEGKSEGNLPGCVHCRCRSAKTDRDMQVCALKCSRSISLGCDLYVKLTSTFACTRYWHRSLNPKKLIDIKFSHLTRNMTMQRTLKLYKLPDNTKVPGFRKLVYTDIPQAHKILTEVNIETKLVPTLTAYNYNHINYHDFCVHFCSTWGNSISRRCSRWRSSSIGSCRNLVSSTVS